MGTGHRAPVSRWRRLVYAAGSKVSYALGAAVVALLVQVFTNLGHDLSRISDEIGKVAPQVSSVRESVDRIQLPTIPPSTVNVTVPAATSAPISAPNVTVNLPAPTPAPAGQPVRPSAVTPGTSPGAPATTAPATPTPSPTPTPTPTSAGPSCPLGLAVLCRAP